MRSCIRLLFQLPGLNSHINGSTIGVYNLQNAWSRKYEALIRQFISEIRRDKPLVSYIGVRYTNIIPSVKHIEPFNLLVTRMTNLFDHPNGLTDGLYNKTEAFLSEIKATAR